MEKSKDKDKMKITELDVELISEEDLNRVSGAVQEIPESCGCIWARTDVWYC